MENEWTKRIAELEKKVETLEREKAIVIEKLEQWRKLYVEQRQHCNDIKIPTAFWDGKVFGINLAILVVKGGALE